MYASAGSVVAIKDGTVANNVAERRAAVVSQRVTANVGRLSTSLVCEAPGRS